MVPTNLRESESQSSLSICNSWRLCIMYMTTTFWVNHKSKMLVLFNTLMSMSLLSKYHVHLCQRVAYGAGWKFPCLYCTNYLPGTMMVHTIVCSSQHNCSATWKLLEKMDPAGVNSTYTNYPMQYCWDLRAVLGSTLTPHLWWKWKNCHETYASGKRYAMKH